ncbi:MAG: asparaginase [Bdellovibrionota bacterium]
MSDTWVPLVDYRRNGVSEVTIHGAISWVSGSDVIYAYGGNVLCYGRSMMKPVQLKVFAKDLAPHLSLDSKAVSVASHNAEPDHNEAVKAILKYLGGNIEHVQVLDPPPAEEAQAAPPPDDES